ncbi:hypothetical protein BCCH1_72150 [Burkholderia contaminans]|uniref:Uncharacterized protein n=1 Tax=Burkholderia contaminans TaxID=488447 RepID=A0A250LLT3_9BURK|nr:hypothetical protein BCCH1_72150 [Burkholderia contaminans]
MTSEIGTVALGEGSARPGAGPGWAESESEPVIASPSIEPLALYLSGPRGAFRAVGTPGIALRADAISRCG